MKSTLKTWKTSRKIYYDILTHSTDKQLNKIPDGFNNNIIWNVGHIIAAQQLLVYKGSGLPMYITDNLFDTYKPGTKPTGHVQQKEIEELKHLLLSLVERTKEDLEKSLFNSYTERTTLTGFHLSSLQDAVEFNNYHEGLHLGYIMSLRKFV